jgi:hypothetical protein
MQRIHAGLLALGTLCGGAASTPALAQAAAPDNEPKIAEYATEARVRVFSDRRVGGVSETFRKPGAELHFEAAHSSGLVGVAELATVSKVSYPHGDDQGGTGYTALLAGGYRWGDPEAWHFGVGAAHENFPGSKATVLTGVDANELFVNGNLVPTGVREVKFNTSYALFEFGYGAIEARYVYTVSKDFRGANTASVCTQLLQAAGLAQDVPGLVRALECYNRGDLGSRGTQLLDVDYKYALDGRTSLLLHGGIKRVKNFSEADITDWKVGVQHKRWGIDWILEAVGTDAKTRELYQATVGSTGETRKLDNTALILTLSYTF